MIGYSQAQYESVKKGYEDAKVLGIFFSTEHEFLDWALNLKSRLIENGADPLTDFDGLADAVIDVALEVLYV